MNYILMGFERRGEWTQLPQEEQQRRIRKHQEGLSRLLEQRSAAGKPHILPATRADFLRRLDRWREAEAEYRRALELASNERERDFLRARLAECESR